MSESDERVETAGVILVRRGGGGLEVLLARRPEDRGFLAGFHGFVVGRVQEGDEEVALEPPGPYRAPAARHWGCAVREVFEELGILPLEGGWVRSWEQSPAVEAPGGGWASIREGIRRGERDLAGSLGAAGHAVDAARFHPIGRWPTPSWAPLETTTEFFALEAPGDEVGLLEAIDVEEHREPTWVSPGEAIACWEAGEWFLSTPIRRVLEGLAEMQAVRDRDLVVPPDPERDPDREMIEILGGVRMLPLATPTLPPATHTNSYLIGRESLALVDPGSGLADEQALLHEALSRLDAGGAAVEMLVLTHHHDDHVDGVRGVLGRFDPDLAAHPETARRLSPDLPVDRLLEDGEILEVDPAGGHRLRVHHTPGHAPGHVCLSHLSAGVLLAGDLVASEGTILIDPPEGQMGPYLESLERMKRLEPAALLPAHGTVIPGAEAHLEAYLAHRRERERQVLDALEAAGGPVAPRDLVEEVYADAPPAVWPIAVRSLRAHLIHLVERSSTRQTDGGFVYESSSSSTKS